MYEKNGLDRFSKQYVKMYLRYEKVHKIHLS